MWVITGSNFRLFKSDNLVNGTLLYQERVADLVFLRTVGRGLRVLIPTPSYENGKSGHSHGHPPHPAPNIKDFLSFICFVFLKKNSETLHAMAHLGRLTRQQFLLKVAEICIIDFILFLSFCGCESPGSG